MFQPLFLCSVHVLGNIFQRSDTFQRSISMHVMLFVWQFYAWIDTEFNTFSLNSVKYWSVVKLGFVGTPICFVSTLWPCVFMLQYDSSWLVSTLNEIFCLKFQGLITFSSFLHILFFLFSSISNTHYNNLTQTVIRFHTLF